MSDSAMAKHSEPSAKIEDAQSSSVSIHKESQYFAFIINYILVK